MSKDDTVQPVEHGSFSGYTIGTDIRFESYPVVKQCPACESNNGYQSFDIYICSACGKWSGIDPLESKEVK